MSLIINNFSRLFEVDGVSAGGEFERSLFEAERAATGDPHKLGDASHTLSVYVMVKKKQLFVAAPKGENESANEKHLTCNAGGFRGSKRYISFFF